MHYELTTLSGGLRVITETMAGVRSVAVGCWVETGTRDELPNEEGCSHFLEHLLFKASENLTARQISETFDRIGAQSNAFTAKDATCFWARLIDDDLPTVISLLGEMLQRPALRSEEIDSERHVVVEEINQSEDDPSDLAFEQFNKAVFEDHSLERPILGTRDSILGMSRDDIAGYWKRRYGAGSVVVAAAGSVEHGRFVELIGDEFGEWGGDPVSHEYRRLEPAPGVQAVHRETEQAHLVLGGEGLPREDDRRYSFDVLNLILGGGMSSRLFQKIREERGLVYAVFSFAMPFTETGAWGVYAGTAPEHVDEVMKLILSELDEIAADGVTEEELARAKGSLRGSLALALEDPNSRMVRLGRAEVMGGEHLSVDERIARVEAVTGADVHEIARTLFTRPRVIGSVGPFAAGDLGRYVE